MLAFKCFLLSAAVALFVAPATVVIYDLFLANSCPGRAEPSGPAGLPQPSSVRWRTSVALAALAWAPLLIGLGLTLAVTLVHCLKKQ